MEAQPTLKSVAAAAGVSTAAVSYAFNRPQRLSAQARERILAVARELGYAGPDAAARSLRTGRTGAIGVIFTVGLPYAFQDPYMREMLGGLTEVTERSRTGLTFLPFDLPADGDDDAVRQSLDAVHRAVIDGAVADGLADDHPAVRVLRTRGIPLVQSSETGAGRCVVIDDRQAGREIGRHLAGLGHRDVTVVVAYPSTPGVGVPVVEEDRLYPYSRLRLAGIREGLGRRATVRVVSAGRNAEESGRLAGELALEGGHRPTAVAADSDVLAAGVLDTVRRRGLVPGRDIAVTGFDDAPFAAAAGLTTVRQPIREKGRLMARMLLDPVLTDRRIVLDTELVVRSSTGPAPSDGTGTGLAAREGTGPAPREGTGLAAREGTGPARGEGAGTAVREDAGPVPRDGTGTAAHDGGAVAGDGGGAAGAPDEWRVGRLDLDAYLRRIGHRGATARDAATLAALHRAHVAAIPFENLDVILGRGISVDLDAVQDKMVARGRGGYCYEHGILFAAVLSRLGFQVNRILARTGDPAEHPRPRSHLVVRVDDGDRSWLADVGFGSGLLTPIPLVPGGPHRQGAWQYELVVGADGAWRLREHDGDRWTTIQTFTEEPQYLVDIDVANHNTATNPQSPFTQRPIVVRKDETSVRRLLGREYTVEEPGRPARHRVLTDAELGDTLRGEFRLDLPAADLAALTGWAAS
jgi:DNA-binding LacI/PurR family transcriptional regulator/arylamine N-acetyltransferase